MLHGGEDLAPETYGEKAIGPWRGDAYRDQYELKIINHAIAHSKALLGICRGFQLMNVGARYEFVIPPELAWGKRGNSSSIGPNAVMIVDARLISIG